MKRNVAIMFVLFAATMHVCAQSDPPVLSAWIRNLTGITGYNGLPANVQLVRYTSSSVYISCSGIPAYSIGPWPGDPNVPTNQSNVFVFPRSPVSNAGTKTATSLGPIAVWSNGVTVFNAQDAMSYNNQNIWHQNAVVVEASSFDACLGHPAPGGTYHHHQNPRCLYEADSMAHSPIIGFSFDGFPIYGAYGYAQTDGSGGIVRMRSSYRLRSITQRQTLPDGTVLSPSQYGPAVSASYPLGYYVEDYEYVNGLGDLDAYNGRMTITPDYPAGTYAYYATISDDGSSAYPYAIGPKYYGVIATENVTSHGHVTVSGSATTYVPLSRPQLIAPLNDSLVQSLAALMSWHAVPGAAIYHIEVSADSLFTAPEANDSGVADTVFQFTPDGEHAAYFWRVRAMNSPLTSLWSDTGRFAYERPGINRWFIVSLPRTVPDPGVVTLFPQAVSGAYSYSPPAGYAEEDSLNAGRGYWIKLPAESLLPIDGDTIQTDTIAVAPGWNLIGSISLPVPVNTISSEPPGMTTSQFFGYSGAYAAADTISPGVGYWVHVDQSGSLILSSTVVAGVIPAAIRISAGGEQPPPPPDGQHWTQGTPRTFLLRQNYPNPFNPQTTIPYRVLRDGTVRIRIYTLLGAEIRTLVDGQRQAGEYALSWDGTDNGGRLVNSGIYLCRLQAGSESDTEKLALIK